MSGSPPVQMRSFTDMATRSMPTVSYFCMSAGDLELGADAVGAGDEDRVLVAAAEEPGLGVEIEETGEAAGPLAPLARRKGGRDDAQGILRAAQVLLDARDRLLIFLEVETRFLVIPLLGHGRASPCYQFLSSLIAGNAAPSFLIKGASAVTPRQPACLTAATKQAS